MTQRLAKYNTDWLDKDGNIVTIDGRQCKLSVMTGEAIYPYKHTWICVTAVIINQDDPYYLEVKRELKDDWSIDVLEMEPEKLIQLIETGEC